MEQKREKITFGQVLIILAVIVFLCLSVAPLMQAQRENLGEELDRANEYAARLAAMVLYYGSSEEAGTDFVRYFDAENCKLLEERPQMAYGEGTSAGHQDADNRDKFLRVEAEDGSFYLEWVDLTDEELIGQIELRGYREN